MEKELEQRIVLGVKILPIILGQIKMANKVLKEKCHCVVCRSNKSRFFKQKINQQMML